MVIYLSSRWWPDEIQMMRGDPFDRENTRYAYRWVVGRCLSYKTMAIDPSMGQSGTPLPVPPEPHGRVGTSLPREELAALARVARSG